MAFLKKKKQFCKNAVISGNIKENQKSRYVFQVIQLNAYDLSIMGPVESISVARYTVNQPINSLTEKANKIC